MFATDRNATRNVQVHRRECLGHTVDDLIAVTVQVEGTHDRRTFKSVADSWDAVQSTLIG